MPWRAPATVRWSIRLGVSAYELDPESVVRRNRKAESERTVTIRPAPDTMSYVTALVPVVQGVAMYAALKREADSARASGDPRASGQVMADTMVQRVTGQAAAEDGAALGGARHDRPQPPRR